jgi:hypothetical protein
VEAVTVATAGSSIASVSTVSGGRGGLAAAVVIAVAVLDPAIAVGEALDCEDCCLSTSQAFRLLLPWYAYSCQTRWLWSRL